ncbi:diguanylate cyclase response regulator [Noviherbaspirillum denitrificans]|uniref:diguanylate cyclase n=2 Tax=Noviherbaspirillum denitrificans TaxID=1968433 RepID=A0A254TKF5_9BURK|nr:diguanylate cyclase response regulator [Noviherbaspirillum denitrificans]
MTPPRGRILIVDDAMENIHFLHRLLQDEHKVVFARDGMKALEMARTQPPDLILLDALMPGMDGFETCAALKDMPETRDIPVIFVTALDSPDDETGALEAGAVDFINKPLNAAVVRARVRTHLALKQQGDLLRAMTMTDGLTRVANRRCFDDVLEREWKRCERSGLPLALILADIDHFKLYNDRYGHLAGDRCLADVAQGMETCLRRPPDLIARYGGEEFAILLPHEDVDGAVTVASRLLDKVRELAIPHEASPTASVVTASLGISAVIPQRGMESSSLIAAADACLYEAKKAGRNRCQAAPM